MSISFGTFEPIVSPEGKGIPLKSSPTKEKAIINKEKTTFVQSTFYLPLVGSHSIHNTCPAPFFAVCCFRSRGAIHFFMGEPREEHNKW